jgi:hypothetical protein
VRLALTAAACLAWGGLAAPVRSAEVAGSHPDLTGFWALRFDSRNISRANLLPAVGVKQVAAHEASDRKVIRWCLLLGMPQLMDSSAPIGIVQGADEVAIRSEAPSAARHIYLDRTKPPDPSVFEAATNGFSIGHWQGSALIVRTTGFSDKGYTSIPGGGFRTPTSNLEERFELMNGGRQLLVTFTWTDPHVFATPHSYAYLYYRVSSVFNAGESYCDSNDAARADFLTKTPSPLSSAGGRH